MMIPANDERARNACSALPVITQHGTRCGMSTGRRNGQKPPSQADQDNTARLPDTCSAHRRPGHLDPPWGSSQAALMHEANRRLRRVLGR